jgi:hypothetical protein
MSAERLTRRVAVEKKPMKTRLSWLRTETE